MSKINVRKRNLKDGRKSLYLDYYLPCGRRILENTGLHELPNEPKNRIANREILYKFDYIRAERTKELGDGLVSVPTLNRKRTNFFDYYRQFMDRFPSNERRYSSVLKKLTDFHGSDFLPIATITENWLEKFYQFLSANLTGETPYDYFKALNRVLKIATKDKLFNVNPAADIRLSRDSNAPKHTLTIEEINALLAAPCPNEVVKQAFLFCCLATGLRYCDTRKLTWSNISLDNVITIIQSKTNVEVSFTLPAAGVRLLGVRAAANQQIFPLPSNNACNKNLRIWAEAAGIKKNITFHCARHTFGTLLHKVGADAFNIAAILGHTSTKHTTRYIRKDSAVLSKSVSLIPQALDRIQTINIEAA